MNVGIYKYIFFTGLAIFLTTNVMADEYFYKVSRKANDLKPSFEYTGKESVNEMRKKCVEAMAESIGVQWTPKSGFAYRKSSGAASNKDLKFAKNKVYAGVPYTSAASGLYQWLYYYDYKTGVFYCNDLDDLESNLGNSCAANVIWATSAVSKTVSCGKSFTTYTMTPINGWLPVGNYLYPEKITSYNKKVDTSKIIASNSVTVMFDSYAQLQPADALLAASPFGGIGNARHALMVIKKPHIIYDNTKSIDGEKSFVIVQDQGYSNYKVNLKNKTVLYHGHLERSFTFNELLKKGYIPLTIAEFKGFVPFEKSCCKFVGNSNNLKDFEEATIESNYRLAVVECIIKKQDGSLFYKTHYLTKGKDVYSGETIKFKVNNLFDKNVFDGLIAKSKNDVLKITLNVTLCNGENYSLSDLKVSLK